MNHCVYCGHVFPPDWKAGFAEPEALKWVERPAIPADAAKQLEMLKVIPMDRAKRGGGMAILGGLSLPIFAGLFYMIYRIVARYSQPMSALVLVGGASILGYIAWTLFKSSR